MSEKNLEINQNLKGETPPDVEICRIEKRRGNSNEKPTNRRFIQIAIRHEPATVT
jgi:hypothetical protein